MLDLPTEPTEPAILGPMFGKNGQLVTYEPVEVEIYKKFTDRFRGIYRVYLK